MSTEQAEAAEGEIVGEEVEVVRNLPAVRASEAMVARGELSVEEVVEQKDKIKQVMERVMTEDVHYGKIPGVNKPSLLKPGAEAINVALRLAPHYASEKIWHDDGHLTVVTKCELHHIPTGLIVGTGEGLCTTRESRYAYRTAKRECPLCGEPQIRRSKNQPRQGDYEGASSSDPPGWYCWRKEGGCGANFAHDDQRITSQEEGKVPNPDLADSYNTVLKMSDKRALVAAVLNATAASDVFTQDVEDKGASASGSEPPSDAQAEPPPFDPATQLLPTARRDRSAKKVVEALGQDQHRIANDLDWTGMLEEAAAAVMPPRAEWKKPERDEFMCRWSNAIAALLDLAEKSEHWHPDLGLAPEGDGLIVQAFEWAFGHKLSLPLPRVERGVESDEDGDVVDAEAVEVTDDAPTEAT